MKTGRIVKRYNSFKASMSCQLVRLFYMLTSILACIALQYHKASSSTAFDTRRLFDKMSG